MATTTPTLTERQQQVKKLLDQGRTPAQIAKSLKITENGVYQHMRRIRAATGEPKAKAAVKRGAAKPAAAKPARRTRRAAAKPVRRAAAKPAAPQVAKPTTPVALSPVAAIKARRAEIEAILKDTEDALGAANTEATRARVAHDEAKAKFVQEITRLAQAEAALTGVTAGPAKSRSSRGNGSNGKSAAAKRVEADAARATVPAPAPEPAPEPGPAPVAVSEPEPAPVAAQEPEMALAGVAEERPGVPSLPEFEPHPEDEADDPFIGGQE